MPSHDDRLPSTTTHRRVLNHFDPPGETGAGSLGAPGRRYRCFAAAAAFA
jgi:hypothetical protein